MSDAPSINKSTNKQIPILARHAVSLSIAFVLGLVLSYFAAQAIDQRIQLNKLSSPDQVTFEHGVGYVILNAAESESITDAALQAVGTIDPQRAGDLLLAIAQSHAQRDDTEDPAIPKNVMQAARPLMERLDATEAIGLYDGLIQVKGIDAIHVSETLLKSLNPKDDAELLLVVDLLDTRLLWSRRWAPLDLWVRWLAVLAESESELTQFNTAKRLGELPEAVDNVDVQASLGRLSNSQHDTVRNTVLNVVAGYAAISKDPTSYEQLIYHLGEDANKDIARRAWMVVGHLNPLSGFAVNWRDADPYVAEAILWAAVKTNPDNDKPAIDALKTKGYEAAGALALNEWRRSSIQVADSDLLIKQLIREISNETLVVPWRCILASKDYLNVEAMTIDGFAHQPITDEQLLSLHLAGSWVRTGFAPQYDPEKPYADALLIAFLEGVSDHGGSSPEVFQMLKPEDDWPVFARLLASLQGSEGVDLDRLVGELPLDQSVLLDLLILALTHADNATIDRFIRSSHPQMVTMAAIASVIKGYQPKLIQGVNAEFLRRNPDLNNEQLRAMDDDGLAGLGLSRIDALPALFEAADAAPPSANREVEAILLKLALWMRGDLGDDFTPTAESLLFDEDMPTSAVLLCLLQMKRPVALQYLFGDLATQRPDLHKLFIQERYWHVFSRFLDTSDLTLWLWGDPEAQGFQLEAMRQWYAVNRWKLEQGWWPESKN